MINYNTHIHVYIVIYTFYNSLILIDKITHNLNPNSQLFICKQNIQWLDLRRKTHKKKKHTHEKEHTYNIYTWDYENKSHLPFSFIVWLV
jgi:hypothetical protein